MSELLDSLAPSKATLAQARSLLVAAFAGDGPALQREVALEIALRALYRGWPTNRVEAKLKALEGFDGSRGERPNAPEFIHNLWQYARARAVETPPATITVSKNVVINPIKPTADNTAHIRRLSGPGLR
jgi:hypothetical protein